MDLIEFMPGPNLNRNLVTKETIHQLVSHILANKVDGWQFLKTFVRNVDAFITELEHLVTE